MKVKKDFILRTVAGNHVVVPTGKSAADMNCMITLNDTGAFLWQRLTEETDEEALIAAVLDVYDVDRERAATSVHRFLAQMREAGCLA